MPPPLVLQLEPTSRCNFSCLACGRSAPGTGGTNIPESLYARILDEMPSLQVVRFQGLGEPMLHPFFEDLILMGLRRNIRFDTISNGSLLKDERIDFILRYLDCLTVSLDSLDEEVFRRLRPGPGLGAILDGLERLAVRKRMMKSPTKIGVNFVASHLNCAEIPGLGPFAERTGIDFVSLVRAANWTLPSSPDRQEALSFMENVESASQAIVENVAALLESTESSPVVYRWLDTQSQGSSCLMPFYMTYINSEGDVLPCCVMKVMANARRFSVGNIGEQSFARIWNGPEYRLLRRLLLTGETGGAWDEICRTCPD
jgi:radical SAM protein with 4Fe4S-binding SPASM domain